MSLTERFSGTPAASGRRTLQLVGGDGLAFLIFAAIGRMSHGGISSPADLFSVVEIAAPFAVAWYVIAPFAGLYRPEIAQTPAAALTRTPAAWLAALPLGILGRMLLRREDVPAITFWVITFVTVLLILLAWRGSYAWATRRQGDQA